MFSVVFTLAIKEDIPAFSWILGHLKAAINKALIPLLKVMIIDFDATLK